MSGMGNIDKGKILMGPAHFYLGNLDGGWETGVLQWRWNIIENKDLV